VSNARQHAQAGERLVRERRADLRRRHVAIGAADVVPLRDPWRQRCARSRIQRHRQRRVGMEPRPGLDIEIGRQRDETIHRGQTFGDQAGQHAAAAVANQRDGTKAVTAAQRRQRSAHAGNHRFAVARTCPQRGVAGRRLCEAVVAGPSQVEARRRVEHHQFQRQCTAR